MATKKNARKKSISKRKTKKSTTKKSRRARKKKSNVISATKYKGSSIEIVEGKVTPTLTVNGAEVVVTRDADTGHYSTSASPYARFATLEEAGKAAVDNESF